jgi:Spy/CpxP family protein refolding chaperone
MTNMKLIVAAAALTLAAGSAFAADPTYNSGAQPAPAQQVMSSDQTGGGQVYQPSR